MPTQSFTDVQPIQQEFTDVRPLGTGVTLKKASGATEPLTPENAPLTVPRPVLPEFQPTFSNRMGERIHQQLYTIPEAMDIESGAAKPELTTAKAKAEYEQQQKEQAQQPGAGHQMTFGNATSTLGKIVNANFVVPRMAYALAKQYIQDPANLAGDIVVAAPGLAEAKLPTSKTGAATKTLPEVPRGPQITPEQQAKFVADIDKANAPYVKSLATEDLAARQRGIAERVQANVQQTHENVRNDLNGRSEALRQRMATAEVPNQPITDAIAKSRKMLAGVPEDLRIFKELTDAIDKGAAEDTANHVLGPTIGTKVQWEPNGVMQFAEPKEITGISPDGRYAFVDNNPTGLPIEELKVQEGKGVPFNDARIQSTALGEKWASASGNLRRALKNVYDAYRNQLQTTADAAGTGREYRALADDWHQYFEDWQGRTPLNKVLNAQHPAYVTPIVKGVGSELLEQQLGRYRGAGAVPESVAEMRDVTKQAKVPPLKPVPAPVPKPPEPGFFARHIPRIIGKTIGGTVGSAIGHPLLGYSIGGELGSEVGKRMTMPTIPTSPQEYQRILLQSKGVYGPEEEISTGEANRRISKGGGSTKVKRMTPPPEQP